MSATLSQLTIDVSKQRFPVAPHLYGLFFEEISRAGDGGLYAEQVRNRSFEDSLVPERCACKKGTLLTPAGWETEFPEPGSMPGWHRVQEGGANVRISLDAVEILNEAHPVSLKLEISEVGSGAGVRNEGFWGIPVRTRETYRLSLYAKLPPGAPPNRIRVNLEGSGSVYATASLTIDSPAWTRYETILESDGNDAHASLAIRVEVPGTLWVDLVSLLPRDTFRRPYGCFRRDLVERLAALRPRFLRFPGGCFVEGFTIETASRWKRTLGENSQRHGHWNLWGYRTTNGIGYHEYLQLCEDLGMEAMFVVNCGLTCQSRRCERVPMEKLDEWVQDALDAVAYANGPADSPWGSVRARNGHPEPFHLKYLEIGNENSGPEYNLRYRVFQEALKRSWPDLVLISNTHTEREGLPTEVVDEHFYHDSYFFASNHDRYDDCDRKGPKVYVGEYANVVDCGNGNLGAALSEAAFLTGIERNQDVVVMCSYAPLLANVHHRVWHPDLIYFDNHRSFGTPSYHLLQLFAAHRGDVVVASRLETAQGLWFLKGCAGFDADGGATAFRNIRVTTGGETLFASEPAPDSSVWREDGGAWTFANGELSPAAGDAGARVSFGQAEWGGYALACEARVSRDASFRIRFLDNGRTGGERVAFEWEVEGGGKTRILRVAGRSREPVSAEVALRIEPDQWNGFMATIEDDSIRCRVNGALVIEAAMKPVPAVCAACALDTTKNEIVIKLVNVTDAVRETEIRLEGVNEVRPEASVMTLTSDSPWDENSFEQPDQVVPRESVIANAGKTFRYPVAPFSATVLRVRIARN